MQLASGDMRHRNPLDLSEIRTHIASFLNRKDCLSCMRVSRDWFHDFVKPVWHTVDCAKDTAFVNVTSVVLDTYGGYISKVNNITTFANLQALQHGKVNSIKSMDIILLDNWLFREMLSDLVRRCQGSIRSLDIRCQSPNPNTLEEQRKRNVHYYHVNDLFTTFPSSPDTGESASRGSSLTTLQLTHVCLTREGFSSLLRCCPNLDRLTISQVMLLYHKPSIPLFTGSKLRYLAASFAQTVRFGNDNKETMSNLLLYSFTGLESVAFPAQNLVMSTALGLITHQETLTSIRIMDKIQDPSLMQWFYFLPRLCRNLEVLSIEQLVLNMDAVEKHRWSCEKLKELRVRFEGLDTPQDIDGCLMNICVRSCTSDTPLAGPGTNMETISSRVTHHLLHFKKLKTVWLGTKVHYLPCMNN
ncbi:hypothetical protein BGX29_011255 [Mortierella sp. GBA35]|nr:hypothetical protein BGX29_011255 [Mortierella sp. GBA35]